MAMPSMVVISVPSACRMGMRQELIRSPLRMTAQAPHSPSPQPSFVPVNWRSSRRTSRRRFIGGASMVSCFPLMVRWIWVIVFQAERKLWLGEESIPPGLKPLCL